MANELNTETLKVALKSIDEFAARELPDSLLIDLDERDEFPEEIVRRMSSGDELGIQLLFVPFDYGGMGGGAFDIYRVCERMAAIDLGLATSELATFLGSDPIRVGGTEEQKREYMSRIAKEGALFAYGATEPEAGSDLGALKTIAERVVDNGTVTGYRINGAKQWITNGGVADLYTVLALAPGGPSWFVVDAGADGFTHGQPEDKHGIRLSNTAALFLDKVYVDADRLIGGVEGQGLLQAQQVFGYTRLMVAAFGLGAGWAALDRAIAYSRTRVQAGGPLSEKPGYTYKLIVPHAVALEAARAAIEETAERLDAGEGSLNIEGAVAKYLATEAGDAAADAAIQAHGGYGYTHDYVVEKIKRDVRITRIYEGTSEIMEITIARGRWQDHLKSSGSHYHDAAGEMEALHGQHPEVGADCSALAHHALAELLERCRVGKLTRNQHVLMRLGALAAEVEGVGGARPPRRPGGRQATQSQGVAAASAPSRWPPSAASTRATPRWRSAPRRVRWVTGSNGGEPDGFETRLGLPSIHRCPGRAARRLGSDGRRPVPAQAGLTEERAMTNSLDHAAAIVGIGAIMPDAPDAAAFWNNVKSGRYSISEVDPARWDPALYYDPDPEAPDKTYSKIGGWVRDWEWNPLGWKLPIPPKVGDSMDDAQKWAVACTRMALIDAGWPNRPLDLDRTAVIIGSALGGERHYLTALRIMFPEFARELERTQRFSELPDEVRSTVERELRKRFEDWLPVVTEDTMPGELSNCIAGRVANLFNLHGPSFTTDAACASALAAMDATVEGLLAHDFDVAITGGVDRNMGAHTYVKFCAIGALSPTGTRSYSEGADGFVMGEGAALFVVKRLADAIRNDDRIYAVVRGVGGSSDGKGKGITAPNPIGQRFAVERAWENAGISPAECTLMEGHGTSTRVGDAVELSALMEAFTGAHLPPGSIALGSVKSNIGHLKAAAGAAGLLKTTLALHDKLLPPSINFDRPNHNVDWSVSPFAVNTELRDWEIDADRTRVAGVSAFGFGGTNFHIVMEEYMPDHHAGNGRRSMAVKADSQPAAQVAQPAAQVAQPAAQADPPSELAEVVEGPTQLKSAFESRAHAGIKAPLRGALVLGAETEKALANELRTALAEARLGRHLDPTPPSADTLRAPERIAIDFADGDDLVAKAEMALRVMQSGNSAAWPALRGRSIYRGSGAPGKTAFLYTGQGSQYANMLADLRQREPVVAETFEEADEIMVPLLEGRRLSDIIFPDRNDPAAVAQAEEELRRTEITQPAVITVDIALTRLLAEYGIAPDMVMGHSVGEYGALVAAGALSFEHALEAVSARGREMAILQMDDPGMMAAAFAPLEEVEEIVAGIDGYVVLANINSTHQVVVGGTAEAVQRTVAALQERGHTAVPLPVSHAFHTKIVAPASGPLRVMLQRLGLHAPKLPIVANVNGELYPTEGDVVEQMLDLLSRQIASPVQFVKGLRTLYDGGGRIFIEAGPKHALQGFASDVLGDDKVMSLATNHPKQGDVATFNSALCGLWAAGLGAGREPATRETAELKAGATGRRRSGAAEKAPPAPMGAGAAPGPAGDRAPAATPNGAPQQTADDLEQLFAEFLERGRQLMAGRGVEDARATEPVVITGASLGLPGAERLFDEANIGRLLNGEQGIGLIPGTLRREMLDKHITRLVKSEEGLARFETIDRLEDVIKLAARAGALDLVEEFGVDDERLPALGRDTQLAIAAGIDALRNAGIPLVLRYKTTSKGTKLPERWSLPDELRDDTGVIYCSAFPGLEEMADEATRYTTDRMRRERMAALESLRAMMLDHERTDQLVLAEVERRIHDLGHQLEQEPYALDRRLLFRLLPMGHSQFAELIGARGPNTQINSACASTTQAIALAEDWIRAGRCRRVVIVAADDATSDTMMGWIGAGFLA